MTTADPVDELSRRTLKAVDRLTPWERDRVVERILRADPELEPVARVYIEVRRLRMPLRRDGVT